MDDSGQLITKNPSYPRVLNALVKWYSGEAKSISAALEEVDLPRSTFYNVKSNYADDFALIDAEARRIALNRINGVRLAFDAESLLTSIEAQRKAREALLGHIDALASILAGETMEYQDDDGDVRVIVPYPRDRIAAANSLLELAKGWVGHDSSDKLLGLLGRLADAQRDRDDDQATEEQQAKVELPLMGPTSNFSRVEIEAPDGRVITITSDDPVDVVDES